MKALLRNKKTKKIISVSNVIESKNGATATFNPPIKVKPKDNLYVQIVPEHPNPKIGKTYMYYWKDGKPVKNKDMYLYFMKWEDDKYKIVKQQNVNWFWVSTVWLGLNHSHTGNGVLIFESMVFCRIPVIEITIDRKERKIHIDRSFRCDLDQCRYRTINQARRGHKAIVKLYSNPFYQFIPHLKQHFENFITIK